MPGQVITGNLALCGNPAPSLCWNGSHLVMHDREWMPFTREAVFEMAFYGEASEAVELDELGGIAAAPAPASAEVEANVVSDGEWLEGLPANVACLIHEEAVVDQAEGVGTVFVSGVVTATRYKFSTDARFLLDQVNISVWQAEAAGFLGRGLVLKAGIMFSSSTDPDLTDLEDIYALPSVGVGNGKTLANVGELFLSQVIEKPFVSQEYLWLYTYWESSGLGYEGGHDLLQEAVAVESSGSGGVIRAFGPPSALYEIEMEGRRHTFVPRFPGCADGDIPLIDDNPPGAQIATKWSLPSVTSVRSSLVLQSSADESGDGSSFLQIFGTGAKYVISSAKMTVRITAADYHARDRLVMSEILLAATKTFSDWDWPRNGVITEEDVPSSALIIVSEAGFPTVTSPWLTGGLANVTLRPNVAVGSDYVFYLTSYLDPNGGMTWDGDLPLWEPTGAGTWRTTSGYQASAGASPIVLVELAPAVQT